MEEKVKIKNTLGKNISAVIHEPEIETGKLAILCPGFLDSKDYAGLVDLAKKLCSQEGYTVVRFDPTGTWESEGDILEYNTTQYLKDIKNVLEYMFKQKNYTHVLLGGHSRGGQMSLLYAAHDIKISLVIAIMPSSVHNWKTKRYEDWQLSGFNISSRDIPNSENFIEFKVPYSHALDLFKYNIIEDIKNIHVPIIFLTGELDTTVLPENVKELFEKANEPKRFILIKDIGHDYRHYADQVKKVNDIIINCIK